MLRISRQLTMMLLVILVAGCATEKYSLRRIVGRPRLNQWHARPQQSKTAPVPPESSQEYDPVPQEEIPLPPSGASYEEPSQDDSSRLKKAERPPLLLRPVGWEFSQPEPIISLRPPKAN